MRRGITGRYERTAVGGEGIDARFLYAEDDGIPALVRAGLAHVQFETIQPFLDGNGRVGRLLITFLLCHAGVLREPLLYLSLYFKQGRDEYYDLLGRIRTHGDWEAWLAFFLDGVRETAEGAASTAQRLTTLFGDDRERILPEGRRAGSMLGVHDSLKARPVTSLPEVVRDRVHGAHGGFGDGRSGVARRRAGIDRQASQPGIRVRPLPGNPERGGRALTFASGAMPVRT